MSGSFLGGKHGFGDNVRGVGDYVILRAGVYRGDRHEDKGAEDSEAVPVARGENGAGGDTFSASSCVRRSSFLFLSPCICAELIAARAR